MLDGFSDLIAEIQQQGELVWATQKKTFLDKTRDKRTPDQIKQDVLGSARLKHVISSLCSTSRTLSEAEVKLEAKTIVDEMAHNFDLKSVRTTGYFLVKVLTQIYQHIFYNTNLKQKISEIIKQGYPVLYLPTHRSYMDFLLVSVICFHTNLPLPAIAAGQDFLGLAMFSRVLRNCGAFFIRRSFGSDQLYWAIFHEYVQQHINKQHAPVEFFLEGTRSRTSKALLPKQGMLATCLEPLLKSQVSDIYIVPISITYERLLEEQLYANELLGIPKPKESMSSLMKARTILNQSYGTIIINFAEPLSARELLFREHKTFINRLSHTLTPRFIFELNPSEYEAIQVCSYDILEHILNGQVIQPISLICTILLCSQATGGRTSGSMSIDCLVNEFKQMKNLFNNLSIPMYMPIDYENNDEATNTEIKRLFYQNFKLHSNLFDFSMSVPTSPAAAAVAAAASSQINLDKISLNEFVGLDTKYLFVKIKLASSLQIKQDLHQNAATYLCVCSYRNQLINFLVNYSIVLVSLINFNGHIGDLYKSYTTLVSLFSREFLFNQHYSQRTFTKTLNSLKSLGLVDDSLKLSVNAGRLQMFFLRLMRPYLANYLCIYKFIVANHATMTEYTSEKDYFVRIQNCGFDFLTAKVNTNNSPVNDGVDFELLSLNVIQNAVQALSSLKILAKTKDQNATFNFTVNINGLRELCGYLDFICGNLSSHVILSEESRVKITMASVAGLRDETSMPIVSKL